MRRLLGEQTSEKPLACRVGRYVNRIQSRRRSRSVYACGLRRTSVDDFLSVLEMVWINWAGPMSHLISDMEGEFEAELGEFMEAHGTRQYFTASEALWQNGLVERSGGIWKAAARKAIKDVGARGFVEMRRLASMVNWAKNARINSSGYSSAQWVIGRGYKLPRSFWTRSKAANWHRWNCQITRLRLVNECHGCGLLDVHLKTWTLFTA